MKYFLPIRFCPIKIYFFYLVPVLLLFTGHAIAQPGLTVTPRLGYGNFQMQNMKNLQQELTKYEGLPISINRQFPAAYLPGLSIGCNIDDRFSTGVVLETGATSGQLYYLGPSESFVSEQRMRYKSIGIFGQVKEQLDQFVFFAGLEAAYFKSSLEWSANHQTGASGTSFTNEYNTVGLGVKPFGGFGYVIKRFVPSVSVSYLVYKGQPYQLEAKGGQDLVLLVRGKSAGPDWSGLQANLSLGFLLFQPTLQE